MFRFCNSCRVRNKIGNLSSFPGSVCCVLFRYNAIRKSRNPSHLLRFSKGLNSRIDLIFKSCVATNLREGLL